MVNMHESFYLEKIKINNIFDYNFEINDFALKRSYLNKIAQNEVFKNNREISNGFCLLWKDSYGYKYQQSSNTNIYCPQTPYDVDGLLNQIKKEAISAIALDINRGFNLELKLLNNPPSRFKQMGLSVSELSCVEFDYFLNEYKSALNNIRFLTEYILSSTSDDEINNNHINQISNLIL